jgi:hypothetical protein
VLAGHLVGLISRVVVDLLCCRILQALAAGARKVAMGWGARNSRVGAEIRVQQGLLERHEARMGLCPVQSLQQ